MDPNTPMVLAGASYASRDDAQCRRSISCGVSGAEQFDHMDVAVLAKDADGELQVERHDSTAKHFAWGSARGRALCNPGVAAIAVGAGARTAHRRCVGHFWNNIRRRSWGRSASSSTPARRPCSSSPSTTRAPPRAGRPRVGPSRWRSGSGDLDATFDDALKKAQATQPPQPLHGA